MHRSYTLTLLLVFFGLFWGGSALAQEDTVSTLPSATTTPLSPIQQQISEVKDDIEQLNRNLEGTTGDARVALQIQQFLKNKELRELIKDAIEGQLLDDNQLSQLVREQQRSTEIALTHLEATVSDLTNRINATTSEDQAALVSRLEDAQGYLNTVFLWGEENLNWRKEVGLSYRFAENLLVDRVEQRLRVLGASVHFLYRQTTVLKDQIRNRAEGDRSALELELLTLEHRLEIATRTLVQTYQLADRVGLSTSEYKRQVFTVTGNITGDILEFAVAAEILEYWFENLLEWGLENALDLLIQVTVIIALILAARWLSKIVRNLTTTATASKKLNLSKLMQDFFVSASGKLVWIIALLIALSQLGVNLTPVLTGFGIAGLVIGFALQDTLSNFASGMMLLVYKPFDVGDVVSAGGVEGKVSHMSLVNTTIKTFDNEILIVPNNKIWGDVIKNVTHERIRRVDMIFGIGYEDDLLKAERVLTEIVKAHPNVLKSPEPMIKVNALNTSSVDFAVRPWVKTEFYWDVYWDITREVKLTFDREGISIPYPQQDVHLHLKEQTSESKL